MGMRYQHDFGGDAERLYEELDMTPEEYEEANMWRRNQQAQQLKAKISGMSADYDKEMGE